MIFGAGGPLAAAAAPLLTETHTVRLTDLLPLADIIAANEPQSPGAPLPVLFDPPHEAQVVDITDYDQVLAACADMDAIVNCTVNRPHPVEAFRVNCLGAYNVMRAAVAHGIRRVVHTGPHLTGSGHNVGYNWDFDISADVPPRPGHWLYAHSKYLGHEVVRIFAESYDLEVPALYFGGFMNPVLHRPRSGGVGGLTISWNDAALAVRRALEVPSLPRPLEVFNMTTDLPHRKFPNEKAKRLLGWQPRDILDHLWGLRP